MLPLLALTATATVTAPGLVGNISRYSLENGLTVLLDPQPARSMVAVVVGYPVGAAGAPPGRHELTHLTEHVLFRRAGRAGDFAETNLIDRVGGKFNGTTYWDRVVYHQVVPPEWLEAALWLERERMAFSRDLVTAEDVELEKKIVARELELKKGVGFDNFVETVDAFVADESAWLPPEDPVAEAGANTLEEVRWLIERMYRPDHAVIAVSGRFDPDHVRSWLSTHMGTLPVPDIPPPEPPPIEMQRDDLHAIVISRRARTERLKKVWITERQTRPGEGYAFERVLSRYMRELNEHPDVHSTDADVDEVGPFEMVAVSVRGRASSSLEELRTLLDEHVKRLLEDPEKVCTKKRARGSLRLRRREGRDEPRYPAESGDGDGGCRFAGVPRDPPHAPSVRGGLRPGALRGTGRGARARGSG